jgi:tRNA modification GTPase
MSRIPHPDEAIAAIASASGGACRGIVRLSGVDCEKILCECGILDSVSLKGDPLPSGRVGSAPFAHAVEIAVPGLAIAIPATLYFWRGSRSYTGQPLAEIHAPGSPPLLEAILACLFAAGARAALPGEFTQRAFLAGRIDLLQAEAIPGVVDARNQFDLRIALEQLGGGVSTLITRLRGDLLDLLADLEAGLDFADEDIEFVTSAMTVARIGLARESLESLLLRAKERLRSSSDPRVVLAGPPNAGKSTLFNTLLGTRAAIVSNVPGTTRDYLAADLAWDGTPFTLIDTAGCEAAAGEVAEAAQAHSRRQIAEADLVVWCLPGDGPSFALPERLPEAALVLMTKSDLVSVGQSQSAHDESPLPSYPGPATLRVSARLSEGIDELKSAILERLAGQTHAEATFAGSTAARCLDSLTGAAESLDRALRLARSGGEHDLLAIELRDALEELGKITGAIYTDDILDRIFSRFCIGK